jgi:hypothetical protein
VVQLKRAFASRSAPPAGDFAEVSQMTTVYTTTEARQDRSRTAMEAAAACERAVNDEYGTQITEGWAEVAVPRSTSGVGLEARVITASMTVA